MTLLGVTVHRNSVKLAGLYLAILMTISVFFSLNLYQLSIQELDRSLRRPIPASTISRLPADTPDRRAIVNFLAEREAQYEAAQDRIVQRLIFINVLILFSGGILSYYFALRTLKPIEEAHEAQRRFTADASHELRTPLAAMRAENEVALMDPKLTVKKAKQVLESNIEELSKLTALSAGLLQLAQGGKMKLEREAMPLAEVLQQAVNRVMPLAEKKNILIHASSDQTKVAIRADKATLVEAFVTVLDNAIKYSPGKTEVSMIVEEASKDVTIRIADQGIGIKASDLPHIFERFYRADTARSKHEVGGYGLGLAIAKQSIELHGGTITVSSQPTKGSTFSIILPVVKR